MSMGCPVCKVKKPGLCIHQKMMLGMMVVVVMAAAVLLIRIL